MPNWCAPQVSKCRSWLYKAVNPPLRKADRLSLAIGVMLCGSLLSIASYKLGQKSEFKFWCELGWFLQRQSHIRKVNALINQTTDQSHLLALFVNCLNIYIIASHIMQHLEDNNILYDLQHGFN